MTNTIILTGNYNGFDKNGKLLIKLERLKNNQIVKITIDDTLKNKITNFIRNNDVIGIVGNIELDKMNNIIIVATKVTFMSKNNKTEI